jgi:uncharacterized protein YdeI (YjbR/CyaY-like superfamily)
MAPEPPELAVADAEAWRGWLEQHHSESTGVWLVLAKKGVREPTCLNHELALLEALCFGWIDGQVRRGDAALFRQRFTPRRPRSAWSRRNTELAERLIDAGRMRPAGLRQVEQAKEDGRWQSAYAGAAEITVPPDLAAALAAAPRALAMFATLSSQNRYALLYRLATARRAETRVRRIATFVQMLDAGETIHPQRRTPGGG